MRPRLKLLRFHEQEQYELPSTFYDLICPDVCMTDVYVPDIDNLGNDTTYNHDIRFMLNESSLYSE